MNVNLSSQIICVALGVVLYAATCSANDVDYIHDLEWQEKIVKKHFPSFTHPATSEHMLQMVRWAHNGNEASYAEAVSQIYRNPLVDEILAKVNDACLEQILKVYIDILSGKSYALYVEDSSGRQASGLLKGDYLWLGKYHECTGQTDETGEIVMNMCLSIYTDQKDSTAGLYIGTCFPRICTEANVSAYMELLSNYTSYSTVFCPENNPYTSGEIAAMYDIGNRSDCFLLLAFFFRCIFSILAFFVLVGTVCETVFICMDMYYVEENPAHEARKRSLPAYLLLCFSLIKNTTALMNTERKESTIAVLDGIRFLSMAWVILGHTLYFSLASIGNVLDVTNFSLDHIGAQVLINGTFSVDSFFFLSGLLVTYLAMREMRRSGSLNIPVMYLLRYLRLTPTMVLVMLFASTLYLRMAEEPIYEVRNTIIADYCKSYWWTNVLYINNLYPENFGLGCISWVWYLANDWQFFLISPFFIYLFYKRPIYGFVSMGIVFTGSIAVTGALASHFELYPDVIWYAAIAKLFQVIYEPGVSLLSETSRAYFSDRASDMTTAVSSTTPVPEPAEDDFEYFSDIYARPWCRIGAYLVGMTAGYLLYTTNKKFKMHMGAVIVLWPLAFAVGLTLIYGWWGTVSTISLATFPSIEMAAFYEATKRPMWAICLMWVTIACTFGYGGPINRILSWKVFMPLSRLTFCAYLIHPLVIFYMWTAREVEGHIRVNIYIYYYVAALVLSYAAAYLLHVVVEAPLGGLTKVIFYTPRGKKPWYAIFNINVESRPTTPSNNVLPMNGSNSVREKGDEKLKSLKQPIVPPPYTDTSDERKMAYENPAAVHDEMEMEENTGKDERTSF